MRDGATSGGLLIRESQQLNQDPQMPTLLRLNWLDEFIAILEDISSEIVIAGCQSVLLPSGFVADARDQMQAFEAGVWCAGAAEYAASRLDGLGRTAVVHFGPSPANGHPDGLLTHTILLIELVGEWYAIDLYFGEILIDPLRLVISSPGRARRLQISAQKFVLFPEDKWDSIARGSQSWLYGRYDIVGTSHSLTAVKGGRIAISLWNDANDMQNLHLLSSGTLDYLEDLGFPRDFSSMMFLPYGVYFESAWTDVSTWSEVWQTLGHGDSGVES